MMVHLGLLAQALQAMRHGAWATAAGKNWLEWSWLSPSTHLDIWSVSFRQMTEMLQRGFECSRLRLGHQLLWLCTPDQLPR